MEATSAEESPASRLNAIDGLLVRIFGNFTLAERVRHQLVCRRWERLLLSELRSIPSQHSTLRTLGLLRRAERTRDESGSSRASSGPGPVKEWR